MKLLTVIGSAFLAHSASANSQTFSPTGRLAAQSNVLDVRENGKLNAGEWTLSDNDPDVRTIDVQRGQRGEVCFISGQNSLCRAVRAGEHSDFVVSYQGRDYPTRILGLPPPANFDRAYQKRNRGKVSVSDPEVYELVNVAIALTPFAREDPALVMKDSAYYGDVLQHFAPVARHPFVQWLDKRLRASLNNYVFDKMNGFTFRYASDGKIIRKVEFDRIAVGIGENSLAPMLAEMQDFSDRSNFRRFYTTHKKLYASQARFLRDGTDVPEMLRWLKIEFPGVKPYDYLNVLFSPLVYRSQSGQDFKSNGFTEQQLHVNFPYLQNYTLPVTGKAKLLERSNQLFGEMNEQYTHPAAERYRSQIEQALSNREFWAAPDKPVQYYVGPYSLFMEHMNWAVTDLYYLDHAPAADAEKLIQHNEETMRERRGFVHFPEFDQWLVKTYKGRAAGTTIVDLYPQIIAWFAARNQGSVSINTTSH